MKPYYEHAGITIYHGDCREVLSSVRGRWYDAIIADPPYGTGKYETDIFTLDKQVLELFERVAKATAVFGYPEDLVSLCMESGRQPIEWVTWFPPNKNCSFRSGSRLPRSSEHIAIFGEIVGADRLFKPRTTTVSWLSFGAKSQTEAKENDVWTDASPGMGFNSHLRQHPNEKPLSVLKKLVLMCSDENEIVCDPFCGSGTALQAAKDLGRRAIGIEIEEKYCEIAAKRLSQEVLEFNP